MGRCALALLLGLLQLAAGARPQRSRHDGSASASTLAAPLGALTNSTGGDGSLMQAQGQQAATQSSSRGCYTVDPPPGRMARFWQWAVGQFRTERTAPRQCATVTATVTCTDPVTKQREKVSGEYICGKNVANGNTKRFKANGCVVVITNAVVHQKYKKEDCKCLACSFSLARTTDEELNQISWGPWEGLPGESVWETGTRTLSTESWTYWVRVRAASGFNKARVWMAGHPHTVAVIKVALLILIGVATGGLGSAAVIITAAVWTGMMSLLATYNTLEKVEEIRNDANLPAEAKAACIAVQGTKWAVGMLFGAASVFMPFSEEMASAVNAGSSLGFVVLKEMGQEVPTAGDFLASHVVGLAQTAATTEVTARAVKKFSCEGLPPDDAVGGVDLADPQGLVEDEADAEDVADRKA